MSIQIRPLHGTDEINAGFEVFLRSMVGLPIRGGDASSLTEPGRYLGAFDAGQVVAGADSYTSWLVVPGGARVPHAAVTHVGVLPTHTRRGIVTSLITDQLSDFAARGEVVASLRASEAVIYERFGYAVATSAATARITTSRARLRTAVPSGGEVRLADDADRAALLPRIYGQALWNGAIDRPAGWWRAREQMAAADPTRSYLVVHATDGLDDGYAIYQPRDTRAWFTSDERTITVGDFVAHTSSARVGLLRHLLSLDLVDVVEIDAVATDDPLPTLFTDHRAVTLGGARDETWLRLVDVRAALDARSYRDADPVVIEVADPLLPANDGRYQVSAKGAQRTNDAPDVVTDVASLAAAYLGGTRWWQLATAGRAVEPVPGGIPRADELFSTDRTPFAGTTF